MILRGEARSRIEDWRQNAFGNPASFNTPFAVWVITTFLGTVKLRWVRGLNKPFVHSSISRTLKTCKARVRARGPSIPGPGQVSPHRHEEIHVNERESHQGGETAMIDMHENP
jgi:hypothetical protein